MARRQRDMEAKMWRLEHGLGRLGSLIGKTPKDWTEALGCGYCVKTSVMSENQWTESEKSRCHFLTSNNDKKQNRSSWKSSKRLTKIVCTIGPACNDVATLKEMIRAGMNVARINCSHGDGEALRPLIDNIKAARKELNLENSVAIALDTKGPEIRTGVVASNGILFREGDHVVLTTDKRLEDSTDERRIFVDYELSTVVKKGTSVFIDDGLIEMRVEGFVDGDVECVVKVGGLLGSRKGVNLPGTKTLLPSLSEKDEDDIVFGVRQGIDFIFASFIRDSEAIRDIRRLIVDSGGNQKIIAKIENEEGLDNLTDIISAADGVMVARGDLGIEIPPEKVFVAQRRISSICNEVGKPVVVATQMMESMTTSLRPTRAEVTDVAFAVQDSVDAVMLSGETANGNHPVRVVETMSAICLESESILDPSAVVRHLTRLRSNGAEAFDALCVAVAHAAVGVNADCVVCVTRDGDVQRLASKLASWRLPCPVVTTTTEATKSRGNALTRGIYPSVLNPEAPSSILHTSVETSSLKKIPDLESIVAGILPRNSTGKVIVVAGGDDFIGQTSFFVFDRDKIDGE